MKDSNDDSSSKGETREEKENGSCTQSKTKHCVMNKMASGSKDICPRLTEEKRWPLKKQRSDIHYSSKNMRSMQSSEKPRTFGERTRRIQMGRNLVE